MATPTSIAYIKDAAWAEPPARLFARLLADTVTSRAGLVVVSGVQSISDPSSTLTGELRMFGIDSAINSAVVTYDAALVRAGQTAVEKRRFEARAPVAAIDGPNAGAAFERRGQSGGGRSRGVGPPLGRSAGGVAVPSDGTRSTRVTVTEMTR